MQTTQRILALVHGVAGLAKAGRIGVDSRLLDEGGIDSFGLVSLVAEIDRAFSIILATEDLTAQNFHSVHTIARLVESYVGTEPQPPTTIESVAKHPEL